MKKRHTAAAFMIVSALACGGFSANSFATDPVTAGTTNIGTHPWYGGAFSGFWRTGNDYAVLTDGSNTYLNTSSSGGMYFRNANNGPYLQTIGQIAQMYLDPSGNLTVGGVVTAGLLGGQNGGVVGTCRNGTGVAGAGAQGEGVFGLTYATSAGQAGVHGVTTTAYGVEGQCQYACQAAIYAQGALVGDRNLRVSGNAYKPGGGPFAATSDLRVKKDVLDFNLGLKELERVRTVKFKYNGLGGTKADGKQYVGVIAQELEKTLPFMVSSQKAELHEGDKQTSELKQVDSSAFTYMLINAVRELAKQNRELAARGVVTARGNDALAAQNKELERVVCEASPKAKICGREVASNK